MKYKNYAIEDEVEGYNVIIKKWHSDRLEATFYNVYIYDDNTLVFNCSRFTYLPSPEAVIAMYKEMVG